MCVFMCFVCQFVSVLSDQRRWCVGAGAADDHQVFLHRQQLPAAIEFGKFRETYRGEEVTQRNSNYRGKKEDKLLKTVEKRQKVKKMKMKGLVKQFLRKFQNIKPI